jgi:hypothetical protein
MSRQHCPAQLSRALIAMKAIPQPMVLAVEDKLNGWKVSPILHQGDIPANHRFVYWPLLYCRIDHD